MPRSTDRGQLVLVGALLLAAVLLSLALLLNTVIFTENLATRADAEVEGSPEQFRDAARAATAESVQRANQAGGSHADLRAAVRAAVRDWSTSAGREYYPSGVDARVSLVETTNGTHVEQTSETRNFTDGNGAGNWTLGSVDGARRVRLNVSRGSLYQVGVTGSLTTTEREAVAANAFHVVVDDGSPRHVYLFQDADGQVRVLVEEDGGYAGANDADCAATAEWVVVDLLAGTVGGTACGALAGYPAETAHEIRYRNATHGSTERAIGTYDLLVAGTVDESPYYDDESRSPTATDAVYAATVRVRYASPETEYDTQVRVVP